MLGGNTSGGIFVGQKGVGYVLVEEVRVEGDHLVQLRNSNINELESFSKPSGAR